MTQQCRRPGIASRGAIVLADGPRPVFYSRTVHTAFQYPVSELHDGGPSDDERLAYLQAMVGPDMLPALRAHTSEVASWTSAAALLERVAELRRPLEGRFMSLRVRVEATYKLPSNSSRVLIEVPLVDLRTDRSMPLPSIPR